MKKLMVMSCFVALAACSGNDGTDGTDGPSGDDGASGAFRSSAEPAGDNCTGGGTKLEWGVDANADGTLNDNEVTGTSYSCNGEAGTAGADGADGTAGADGADGAAGADGADGAAALIATTAEAAGGNCADGGLRVDYGVDTDGNGTLDAAEIQGTSYVCDGADGVDGLDTLLVSNPEPVSVNCPNGGTRVDSGLDLDRSGTLEMGEITSTAYSCNGANGLSSLITSSPEPAGANCAAGGAQLSWGQDDNADGALQAAEVDGTQFVCDGVDGTDGTDGTNGTDGTDGTDGTNGTDGTDGAGALVNVTPETAGANCAEGGIRVDWGQDDDGNGTLGMGEVDGTQYVCNGISAVDPQCQQPYITLDLADRNVSSVGTGPFCDGTVNADSQWAGAGWYRFEGAAGTQMPETAPAENSCGTHAPGWLNGAHPQPFDGVVSRQACFNWSGNTCNWSANINVVDCGAFYLYELTPHGSCNLRYCGE